MHRNSVRLNVSARLACCVNNWVSKDTDIPRGHADHSTRTYCEHRKKAVMSKKHEGPRNPILSLVMSCPMLATMLAWKDRERQVAMVSFPPSPFLLSSETRHSMWVECQGAQ